MFFTRRVLIYTTFGHQKYFKIAGKLSAAGISYTTKSRNNNLFRGGHGTFMSSRDTNVQYDIYVKKEDKHKAQRAIHKS